MPNDDIHVSFSELLKDIVDLCGLALASGARGPRFDSRSRREKFRCPNTLSLVSFAGMTLDKRIVLRIGMLTGCSCAGKVTPCAG